MERHLDEELKKLNTDLLKMAALTEDAIHKSIEALKRQDKALAEFVIEHDSEIDDLEVRIEENTIELLALFQPMAKDLRFITTGMKINAELERIADLTVNICQRVLQIAGQPLLKSLEEVSQLADNAKKMVKGSIDSFVNRDRALASKIILSDKESNLLRNIISDGLVNEYMVKDGTTAPRAVALLLITRDLERICDHASSIAEDVIYMVDAKVVKHHKDKLLEN